MEDAPEEVSLSTSRVSVLEGMKLRNEAIKLLFKRNKEERRNRDNILKERAHSKRKHIRIPSTLEDSDESFCKAKEQPKTELDKKQEELRNRGIIKIPKPRTLGLAERNALHKLIEEKRARISSNHVNRIPVDISFQSYLCKQRSFSKK